jgi:HEAT repeat protein
LLPKLEHAGIEGDARTEAIQALAAYPQEHEFLDKRIELETSPEVLLHLVEFRSVRASFERRLLKLLNDPVENVRKESLQFIGGNHDRAEVWQFRCDNQVYDRVVELTQSKSATERGAAVYALVDIRKRNLDRSREVMLRLLDDPSSDVRWRLAFGLIDQVDPPDVHAAIDKLLKDPVPLVRYMTIIAVGSEKHRTELQQLTTCDDKEVAADAAGMLRQIDDVRNAKP